MKLTGTINFTVSQDFNQELIISVLILDLHGSDMGYADYCRVVEEIQEGNYTQDDITGLNLNTLNDEKEYTGEVEIDIESLSSYDHWSGTIEYDVSVGILFKSYEERKQIFNQMEEYNPYTTIFSLTTNNDGDFLKMKCINPQKLSIEVGYSCFKRRLFIHPMNLTKLLFHYKTGEES